MDRPEQQLDFASITADIVSSYVVNNSVHRSDLPNVLASVHAALQGLAVPNQAEPEKPEPRISIKKSITPDFLISLGDGKQYKTLKGYLGKLGLTAEEYRAKWGLPADYPMVAPSYAAKRSELARISGLGQMRMKNAAKAAARSDEKVTASMEASKPKRRTSSKNVAGKYARSQAGLGHSWRKMS